MLSFLVIFLHFYTNLNFFSIVITLNLLGLGLRTYHVIMQEDWRMKMPAMQVLFLTIYLILYVKLRMKSMGKDYPSHVPQDISKVLEIDIVSKHTIIHWKKKKESIGN